MYRNVYRSRVLCNGTTDGLANPPCSVRTEAEPPFVIKFLRRTHQTNIPLLDQIQKWQPLIRVTFGNADHETQIGIDQLLAGTKITESNTLGQHQLLIRRQQWVGTNLLEVLLH